MMRPLFNIGILLLLFACSSKTIETPDHADITLQMGTLGVDKFENYISSLAIYAFRRTAEETFVYDQMLADLDAADIAALENASSRGDAKYFKTRLAIGNYRFFFVGNGSHRLSGTLQKGVTRPGDVALTGTADGRDSIYFLGNVSARVVADNFTPLRVTLNRAVSRIVFRLTGIPSQLDSLYLALESIAEKISIDGVLSNETVTVRREWKLPDAPSGMKDTAVFELLTLPTAPAGGKSAFYLTFRSKSGEEQIKKMPSLSLLPDKYVYLTAEIRDEPGALLSFDVYSRISIFDFFENKSLPDFILKPR